MAHRRYLSTGICPALVGCEARRQAPVGGLSEAQTAHVNSMLTTLRADLLSVAHETLTQARLETERLQVENHWTGLVARYLDAYAQPGGPDLSLDLNEPRPEPASKSAPHVATRENADTTLAPDHVLSCRDLGPLMGMFYRNHVEFSDHQLVLIVGSRRSFWNGLTPGKSS